jgi:hypothetical protein
MVGWMILVITYNKTPDFALTFSHREFRLVGYGLTWPKRISWECFRYDDMMISQSGRASKFIFRKRDMKLTVPS